MPQAEKNPRRTGIYDTKLAEIRNRVSTKVKGPLEDALKALKYILTSDNDNLYSSYINALPLQTQTHSLFKPTGTFKLFKGINFNNKEYESDSKFDEDVIDADITDDEEIKLDPMSQLLRHISERFAPPPKFLKANMPNKSMGYFTCTGIKIDDRITESVKWSLPDPAKPPAKPPGWRGARNDTPVILFQTAGRHVFMTIFAGGYPFAFGITGIKESDNLTSVISSPDLFSEMGTSKIFDMCILNNEILQNILTLVNVRKLFKINSVLCKITGTYQPTNFLFLLDKTFSIFSTSYTESFNCAKLISVVAPERGINCTKIAGIQDPFACQAACKPNCDMNDIFRAYKCLYYAGYFEHDLIYETDGEKKNVLMKDYNDCLIMAYRLLNKYIPPASKPTHELLEKTLIDLLNPKIGRGTHIYTNLLRFVSVPTGAVGIPSTGGRRKTKRLRRHQRSKHNLKVQRLNANTRKRVAAKR
jgi:hypothetical protein